MLKSFKIRGISRGSTGLFGNFPTTLVFAFLVTLFTLTGCDQLFAPTVAEICQDQPAMCNDLNQDGWCRSEKAIIIKMRHAHREDEGDAYKYPLLLAFEDYLACVEKASGIEHIKYRDKETSRLKGVLTAQREIKRLSRETRASNDPYLTHYHWSRYGDEDALARFKAYVSSRDIKDPQLLIFMAEEQIKHDIPATIQTLYEALALYDDADNINTEIFHSLVSIALDQENYRMAYVWQAVTEYYDEEVISNSAVLLSLQPDLPVAVLDAVADDVISALNRGQFDAQALKLYRL